jgi:glutamyl-tRNA synthetase
MPFPEQFGRTRLAPTPSGYLHLGNIASFVLTIGLARRTGANVLLRIDDLDASRARDEYIQDIFQTLEYLGLPWDEGPRNIQDFKAHYAQQHRQELYQQALNLLQEQQLVFACECSRSDILRHSTSPGYTGTCLHKSISLQTPGITWRMRNFPDGNIQLNEWGQGKLQRTYPDAQRYVVVKKKDGNPSYQLASVIDDQFFQVDLVVRGEDLVASTMTQLDLAEQIGATTFRNTYFVHHPLLTEADGSKMSKSAGATAVKTYRERGDAPAEVFREIARHLSLVEQPENWEALADILLRKWIPENAGSAQNL